MKTAEVVLSNICSAVQYLVDRGEMDDGEAPTDIEEVETKVRYARNGEPIDEMIVRTFDGTRIRITASPI